MFLEPITRERALFFIHQVLTMAQREKIIIEYENQTEEDFNAYYIYAIEENNVESHKIILPATEHHDEMKATFLFAHEFGHYLSLYHTRHKWLYFGNNESLIYFEEKRAWKLAKQLLLDLNIIEKPEPNTKRKSFRQLAYSYFMKIQKEALSSYKHPLHPLFYSASKIALYAALTALITLFFLVQVIHQEEKGQSKLYGLFFSDSSPLTIQLNNMMWLVFLSYVLIHTFFLFSKTIWKYRQYYKKFQKMQNTF